MENKDYYEQIMEAVKSVKKASNIKPKIGLVLGSGLGSFAKQIKDPVLLDYREIPSFPVSSVAGHAGQLVLGKIGKVSCAVMSGRVHFYEGYSMPQVTFPVRVLAGLGVKKLLITNAAGAVNPTFSPGDFMVIVDHINLTGDNPLRGKNDERLGPRFPDMSCAYGEKGRKALHSAARQVGISLREGVYAGLAGPSYETPAEIRMLQNIGADAVGMSTVAEVIAASHAGLEVAGLSVITNRAAGLSREPLSHEEVKEIGQIVKGVLGDVLSSTVSNFA